MTLKIVYIDDEIALCRVFEDIYADANTKILSFTDPEEGLLAIDDTVDLVLLDYRLPKTTGEEVAKRIKVKVPVALVSGDLNLELQWNFEKVFTKPFDFAEMGEFLESMRSKISKKSVS